MMVVPFNWAELIEWCLKWSVNDSKVKYTIWPFHTVKNKIPVDMLKAYELGLILKKYKSSRFIQDIIRQHLNHNTLQSLKHYVYPSQKHLKERLWWENNWH